jgi:hypothetical protein
LFFACESYAPTLAICPVPSATEDGGPAIQGRDV